MDLKIAILNLPQGYSEVAYQGRRYSLTREDLVGGKSIKVFARELGGPDFISFNFYQTSTQSHFQPCEMPEAKVIDFLRNYRKVDQ